MGRKICVRREEERKDVKGKSKKLAVLRIYMHACSGVSR